MTQPEKKNLAASVHQRLLNKAKPQVGRRARAEYNRHRKANSGMLTRKKIKPSYQQVLQIIRDLPPIEQRRLRDEMAKMASVQLVHPTATPAAIRQGKRLAKAVRIELAKTVSGTLDEAMQRLRGRSPKCAPGAWLLWTRWC